MPTLKHFDKEPPPRPCGQDHDALRYEAIALLAYLKSQRRGFLPGFELQDWLEAEAEIDQPCC